MKIVLGQAVSNKNKLFADEIKTALAKGKTVYLIVAKQFTFETERKFYELLGAKDYNKINVLSFNRLAQRVFSSCGENIKYIDDVTKSILLFTAVKNCYDSILYFGKNCLKTSFITNLTTLISELIQANIPPEKLLLNIALHNPNLQEKITDISIIYTEYLSLLSKNNLKDNMTAISEAAHIATKTDFFKNSLVCIDEFDTLTSDQLEFFDCMLQTDVVISLPSKEDNKFFGNVFKLYAQICNKAREKGIEIEEISAENISRPKELEYIGECLGSLEPEKYQGEVENITVTEALDYYEEAEYVCAGVRHLSEKYDYSDIVIITRNMESYRNIFAETFKKYNIPFFIDVKQSAKHTSIVLLITTLLDIISSEKVDTDTIMRYIKNELFPFTIDDINLLEDYCYKWSIDGDAWLNEFYSPDDNLETAENIRREIIEPVKALKKKCKKKTVAVICKEIFNYLQDINLEDNINSLYKKLDVKSARELIQIYNCFVDFTDIFTETIGYQNLSLKEFKEIFTKTVSGITYSAPPQTVGGVKMLDASRTRLNPAKIVFVIGVNEDYFPAVTSDSGLFRQKEKNTLDFSFGRNVNERNTDEFLFFYKSLTVATDKLFISYSLSNTKNELLNPCDYLLKIKEYMNIKFMLTKDISPEYYCVTPESAYHYYVAHYSEQISELKAALLQNPYYKSKIFHLESFSKGTKHNITNKKVIKDIFSGNLTLAPTSFETLIKCPFKFFCEYGLKVKERSKVEFSSLSRGNFIHYCLYRIFKDYKKTFLSLSKEKIYEYINERARDYLYKYYGNSDIINERFKANFKIVSDSIIDIVKEIQLQLKDSDFTPVNFEVRIEEDSKNKPLKCKIGDVEIFIKGTIDRIDVADKYIRIIDYKSGKKEADLKPLAYCLDFQLLFYLFSVTEINSEYEKYVPSGVMYMPAGVINEYIERSTSPSQADIEQIKTEHYSLNGFTFDEKTDVKN
ncbi:MAG: exodeoxyribonuclease V subunit gamma, partial [Oscillospiraceae bacterium]|nr:exodeoxyribonuclease V subunit gamma [Oscillospiraceae bacterium]